MYWGYDSHFFLEAHCTHLLKPLLSTLHQIIVAKSPCEQVRHPPLDSSRVVESNRLYNAVFIASCEHR